MIGVQKLPIGPEVIRVPGGKFVAITLAVLGLITTSITICLSVLPSDDEPNKPLAIGKVLGMAIVLLAAGVVLFAVGKRNLNSHVSGADSASIVQNSPE
jgi:hypothetical protein